MKIINFSLITKINIISHHTKRIDYSYNTNKKLGLIKYHNYIYLSHYKVKIINFSIIKVVIQNLYHMLIEYKIITQF